MCLSDGVCVSDGMYHARAFHLSHSPSKDTVYGLFQHCIDDVVDAADAEEQHSHKEKEKESSTNPTAMHSGRRGCVSAQLAALFVQTLSVVQIRNYKKLWDSRGVVMSQGMTWHGLCLGVSVVVVLSRFLIEGIL